MSDFLFELGHEELPPSVFKEIINYLETKFPEILKKFSLGFESSAVYASCRRTAVIVTGLPEKQADSKKEITGPPQSVLYKDGKPTPALNGFLNKFNSEEKDIKFKETGKGIYATLEIIEKGEKTEDILVREIPEIIRKMPLPRTMKWDDSGFEFIRPVRNLLCIFNNSPVKIKLGNLTGSNSTFPNPILGRKPVKLKSPSEYEKLLEKNQVIINHEIRRKKLSERIKEILPENLNLLEDDELLDEICFSAENPFPVLGTFDKKYLSLPRNILVYTLKKHQRFFTVLDKAGTIVPYFIGIYDGFREKDNFIKTGFEEVLVARLEDALFFFKEDLKVNPENRIKRLKEIIFLDKFGTMRDKVHRLQTETFEFVNIMNLALDNEILTRASFLSRNDLGSNIITEKEYANLQGEMGSIYAMESGEPASISEAIFEMYLPRTVFDKTPSSDYGRVLSIMDRLDTLTVFFTAGKVPTGSADPFALRRTAIGLILTVLDSGWDFQLKNVISICLSKIQELKRENKIEVPDEEINRNVTEFIKDRLRIYLTEEKGMDLEIINAVFITRETSIIRLFNKIRALKVLTGYPDFDKIKISFKRVMNIIEGDFGTVEEGLFREVQEKDLYREFLSKKAEIKENIKKGGFEEVFRKFIELRPYIDNFFDNVLVNCEEESLKNNRMAMLSEIGEVFLEIANFKMIS